MTKKKHNKKAVIYLRVSSKEQVKGDGFPRQRERCFDFAHRHGFDIVGQFKDEGVSGTKNIEDRPGFVDLLFHVSTHPEITHIIIENPDRLARDLITSELALRALEEAGVEVWSASGATNLNAGTDDPTAKLIRQVLAAVAEYDKSTKVLRMRIGRAKKKAKTGRCEGIKPFGTKPGEEATLQRMLELDRKIRNAERVTYREIAEELNVEFDLFPTRTGVPWTGQTVGKILRRDYATRSEKSQIRIRKQRKENVSIGRRGGIKQPVVS